DGLARIWASRRGRLFMKKSPDFLTCGIKHWDVPREGGLGPQTGFPHLGVLIRFKWTVRLLIKQGLHDPHRADPGLPGFFKQTKTKTIQATTSSAGAHCAISTPQAATDHKYTYKHE